jgi:hypothetical protein
MMSTGKYMLCMLVLAIVSRNSLYADEKDTIKIDDGIIISAFGDNLDSLLNLYYVQQCMQIEDSDGFPSGLSGFCIYRTAGTFTGYHGNVLQPCRKKFY